jgi:hypothetical protein
MRSLYSGPQPSKSSSDDRVHHVIATSPSGDLRDAAWFDLLVPTQLLLPVWFKRRRWM